MVGWELFIVLAGKKAVGTCKKLLRVDPPCAYPSGIMFEAWRHELRKKPLRFMKRLQNKFRRCLVQYLKQKCLSRKGYNFLINKDEYVIVCA